MTTLERFTPSICPQGLTNFGCRKAGFTLALELLCVIPSIGQNLDSLNRCVESARQALPSNSTIEVVWNSLDSIPDLGSDISLYRPGVNLGYGPAINTAVRRNPSRLIWMLQDDMEIPVRYVDSFSRVLAGNPALALISPGIAPQSRPDEIVARGGQISPQGRLGKDSNAISVVRIADVDIAEMGWVPLSGALVRSSAFDEVGGFDIGFFPVGHTDVDLCWRLRQAGYGVATSLSHHIVHQKGGSTAKPLGTYTYKYHQEYFEQKVRGDAPAIVPVDVPGDVLGRLAQVSTIKFIDFANYAHNELRLVRNQLHRAENQLERARNDLDQSRTIRGFLRFRRARTIRRAKELSSFVRSFLGRPVDKASASNNQIRPGASRLP